MTFKLYFKKITEFFFFAISVIIIYFLSLFVFRLIADNISLKLNISFWNIVILSFSLLCGFVSKYFKRVNDINVKVKYKNKLEAKKLSFLKDTCYIFKTKEFLAELLAAETIIVPLFLIIGIREKTPLLSLILGTAALAIISAALFSLADVAIWLLVHKKWKKIFSAFQY